MGTVTKGKGTGGKAVSTPFTKGVSQPAIRALASVGYTNMEQPEGLPERELATLHGMGPRAQRILSEAQKERGKTSLK